MPRTRLTPREAVEAVLDRVAPLPEESVQLHEASERVLSRDVVSPLDLPPWDNSAMDGYAARADDVLAGSELCIVEVIPAGAFPTKVIASGGCARIFTGAPIPEGADCVVRQEDTTLLDRGRVRIDDARDRGRNVRRRGEDIRDGDLALAAGDLLAAPQIALLAALAVDHVHVHRRPRVAILSTGDELVDIMQRDEILSGRKIASSNTYALTAMIEEAGGVCVNLGIARDDPAELRRRFSAAVGADLLVTSAGMSVGEHDHLRAILEEGGLVAGFWRVRMRPGSPVGFGTIGELPWIGLPGNPVSAMVTFELLVRPAIRKMLGHTRLHRRAVTVAAGEEIAVRARLTHLLRVRLDGSDSPPKAYLTGPQGSGIMSSMVKADALLILPEGTMKAGVGHELQAIRLDEAVHVAEPPF
ncbi:MAG: gephyrin-like molybdotransferase Glp [Gemmatimonadales bacterium]